MYKLEDLLLNDPASNVSQRNLEDDIKLPDYMIHDPEFVGYDDENFQNQIYEWVGDNIGFGTVKDFGCGRGDFSKYCEQYIGIDSNKLMIDIGKQKYPDLTTIADDWMNVHLMTNYTVCIGSVNEDRGIDKKIQFENALTHAIKTTTNAVVFVFSTSTNVGFDFDLGWVLSLFNPKYPFILDSSKFEGISKLVVYCQEFE